MAGLADLACDAGAGAVGAAVVGAAGALPAAVGAVSAILVELYLGLANCLFSVYPAVPILFNVD
jgi:hypothetical protein